VLLWVLLGVLLGVPFLLCVLWVSSVPSVMHVLCVQRLYHHHHHHHHWR
jgi:hypothetical protein